VNLYIRYKIGQKLDRTCVLSLEAAENIVGFLVSNTEMRSWDENLTRGGKISYQSN
jgi:hypothetical protein